MSIAAHLEKLRPLLRKATLIAVSKGCSIEQIQEAYTLGIRDFAENRLEEAFAKQKLLPQDIRWHFIGKVQRNKVAKLIGHFFLIHSVDTLALAEKISRLSIEKTTSILLEVNTSGEANKGGLKPEEWRELYPKVAKLPGIVIRGLMTMAPFTQDKECLRACFLSLRRLREELPGIGEILSMGMSNDFQIAIEEGSTHVRIGTALFHGIK